MALKHEGIDYVQADNAFLRVGDLERAQALAEAFSPDVLHRRLDRYAQWLCPVLDVFGQTYHWSIRQPECVFRRSWTLIPRQAGHAFQSKLDSRSVATRGFGGLL